VLIGVDVVSCSSVPAVPSTRIFCCSHCEILGGLQAESSCTSPSVDELWRQDIDLWVSMQSRGKKRELRLANSEFLSCILRTMSYFTNIFWTLTNLISLGVGCCSLCEIHRGLQADSSGTSPSVDELWRQDIDLWVSMQTLGKKRELRLPNSESLSCIFMTMSNFTNIFWTLTDMNWLGVGFRRL
jgi:hypothetical protein